MSEKTGGTTSADDAATAMDGAGLDIDAKALQASEVETLALRIDELQRVVSEGAAARLALEEQLETQRALNAATTASEAALRDENARLAAEVELASGGKEIEALKTALEAAKASLSAQRDQATKSADAAASTERSWRETTAQLEKRNDVLSKEVVGLTSSLAAMGDRAEGLKLERDQAQDELESIKKIIKRTRRQTKMLGAGGALALLWAVIKR